MLCRWGISFSVSKTHKLAKLNRSKGMKPKLSSLPPPERSHYQRQLPLLPCQWGIFVLLLLVFNYPILAAGETEQIVEYGYAIKSVGMDAAGKSLTAYLELVKNSAVLGPDIPILHLTVRSAFHIVLAFFFLFG